MLAPNFAAVRRGACQEHQVPGAQELNDSDAQLSPAEFLERMHGRCRLDVPSVRGEHKVQMRGTVPAEWSLL